MLSENEVPMSLFHRHSEASAPVRRRLRSRGQSLTEFALVLPLMLLILLFGIDFGRVFLGWVNLNNVVREAANLAAQNPTAWNSANPLTDVQTEYSRLMTADASGIDCVLPTPLPTPSFQNGPDGANTIGQPVSVSITCNFTLITPIIGDVIGNPVHVSSSAAFPIRQGVIANIAPVLASPRIATALSASSGPIGLSVHDSATLSGATSTAGGTVTYTVYTNSTCSAGAQAAGTVTVAGGVVPQSTSIPFNTAGTYYWQAVYSGDSNNNGATSPCGSEILSVDKMCTVPNLTNDKSQNVQSDWLSAGFTTSVTFFPLNPPNNTNIKTQSIAKNISIICIGTAITVTW
jgi:TadE-like protein